METMNIALPDSLKEFVQIRVSEGGFNTPSEYISKLIRADQRQAAKDLLEAEVLKGIRSGKSVPMTEEDWAGMREELRRRFEARKSG